MNSSWRWTWEAEFGLFQQCTHFETVQWPWPIQTWIVIITLGYIDLLYSSRTKQRMLLNASFFERHFFSIEHQLICWNLYPWWTIHERLHTFHRSSDREVPRGRWISSAVDRVVSTAATSKCHSTGSVFPTRFAFTARGLQLWGHEKSILSCFWKMKLFKLRL